MKIQYLVIVIVAATAGMLNGAGCSSNGQPTFDAAKADHAAATLIAYAKSPTTMPVGKLAKELSPDCIEIDCVDRERVVGRLAISESWTIFILGEAMI